MARVPVIESPCPIAGRPLPQGGSDHCSRCDRAVFNLNRMGENERAAFMRGCSGKVCVAYTVRIPVRRRAFGAATFAAVALASLPAAADVAGTPGPASAVAPAREMSPLPSDTPELPNCDDYDEIVLTGGVTNANDAEWADDGRDAPPELPAIEDDGK